MDDFDKLAIETACGVLAADVECPGSQEPATVEAATQILASCWDLVRRAAELTNRQRLADVR